MTETIDAVTQDRALKARHRAMWALGDYPTVASEVIPELGPVLVDGDRCPPGRPGPGPWLRAAATPPYPQRSPAPRSSPRT